MKKSIGLFLEATLIIILVTSACNKFPDGPKFSLRTKKARLAGDWKLQSVSVNGADKTADYVAFLGSDYVLTYTKDHKYKTTGKLPDKGIWSLGEDGDDVYMTSDSAKAVEQSFRMTRLENKDLWFQQVASNGILTKFRFKQ